jgi:hypothetical protein
MLLIFKIYSKSFVYCIQLSEGDPIRVEAGSEITTPEDDPIRVETCNET